MRVSIRDEVLNWLDSAVADLRHAKKSVEIKEYSWACFAAQQAAEKALKALIIHVLGEYPRDTTSLNSIEWLEKL